MNSPYRLVLMILVAVSLLLGACKSPSSSNNSVDDPSNSASSMETMKVPANFNWRTTADYSLTIDADVAGLVQVVSNKGGVYHRAYLNGKDAYTFTLTVPTYETEVKLRHQGQEVLMDLSGKTLFHAFESKNNDIRNVLAGS